MSLISITLCIILGLMGVGLYGLLIARNLIRVVIALQILVKSAILALIAAGHVNGQMNLAQSLAVTVIVADTVVAAIGLALAVQVRRHCGTLDLRQLANLKK